MASKVLLVEGPDDQHVIWSLCKARRVEEQLFEVKAMQGNQELLKSIPVYLRLTKGGRLGVVIDADQDSLARWHSIQNRLIQAGYVAVPKAPDPKGTVLTAPSAESPLPRFGVWIMPDNRTPGMLENFLRFLIPQDSSLLAHAEASIAAISGEDPRFPEAAEAKALIHTWLAWQREPGKPLGLAISERYLDPGVGEADLFIEWLSRLFSGD